MTGALEGRSAVITGGSSGIGRAIAERFAREGAAIVIASRRVAEASAVARPLGGSAIACDVCDPSSVDELFDVAVGLLGRIDILVNSAGVSGPIADLVDVDLGEWRRCIDVNLFGAVHCMRAAGRIMRRQRAGAIVNLSSYLGLRGLPMRTAYCASKFALGGVTEAFARELGPFGVRVNALCPGAVSGALMDDVIARRARAEGRTASDIATTEYSDQTALKTWVEAEDVANAALFLVTSASAKITGTALRIDAGRL